MLDDAGRKKERGLQTVDGENVEVRLQRDLLAAIDTYAATHATARRPPRADVIRLALREWLIGGGFLKPSPHSHEEITAKIDKLDAKVAALKHDGTPTPENALKTMDRAIAKGRAKGLRSKLSKAESGKAV